MDQKELQEKIALYYSRLPQVSQELFSSMKWMETLRDISKKYSLTQDQTAILATETTLVLLGITDSLDYEKILRDELKSDPANIQKIIDEVNTLILSTVRAELSSVFVKNVTDVENTESVRVASDLDSRFANVPPEVARAIAQSDYQKKLYAIGTKNKLQVNKMAALEDVTVKFILGKISSSQYESELSLTTDLPATTVREIAVEVNADILSPIRELMKNPETKSISLEDDEVPLPPYAQKSIPQAFVTAPAQKTEAGIYANSGIEIVGDEKQSIDKPEERILTKNEDSTLEKSNINIVEDAPVEKEEHFLPNTQTQQTVLDGIEHPDDIATSIIGDKLRGSTKSVNITTDYSLPKIGTTQNRSHDPYHEVIE